MKLLFVLLFGLVFGLHNDYISDVKGTLDNWESLIGVVDFEEDFRSHEIANAFMEISILDCFGKGSITMCFDTVYCVEIEIPNHIKGVINVDITDILKDYSFYNGGIYKTLSDSTFEIFTEEKSLSMKIHEVKFSVKALNTDDMFDHYGRVLHFDVKMHPEDLQAIISDPVAEEYYPCNITYNGYEYTFAGCRNKGAMSSLVQCCTPGPELNVDVCRKLSWKFDTYEFRGDKLTGENIFPKSERKRKIYNQKKINLLAMESRSKDKVLHPTIPMHSYYDQIIEFIGGEFARMCGGYMASSRYAKFTMNGVYMGLFLGITQTDDKFTEWHFSDDANEGEGQLWKEIGFPKSPTEDYFLDMLEEGDDDEGSQDDIADLSEWLHSVDINDPNTKMEFASRIDVDSLIATTVFTTVTGCADVMFTMRHSTGIGSLPNYDDYNYGNMYLYKREDEDGNHKFVFILHDLGSVGTGFYAFKSRKWYDDDFDQDIICETGELEYVAGPRQMHKLPASCTPIFKILKIHFMDEYIEKFAEVVENIITEESIDRLSDDAAHIIRPFISREPTDIPSMPNWMDSVEDSKMRLKVWRNEEIEAMQEYGYVPIVV